MQDQQDAAFVQDQPLGFAIKLDHLGRRGSTTWVVGAKILAQLRSTLSAGEKSCPHLMSLIHTAASHVTFFLIFFVFNRAVTMYIKMTHGKAADTLQPLTGKVADAICQELIKQQGNKNYAPKPSLEGRLMTVRAAAQPLLHVMPINGELRQLAGMNIRGAASQVYQIITNLRSNRSLQDRLFLAG